MSRLAHADDVPFVRLISVLLIHGREDYYCELKPCVFNNKHASHWEDNKEEAFLCTTKLQSLQWYTGACASCFPPLEVALHPSQYDGSFNLFSPADILNNSILFPCVFSATLLICHFPTSMWTLHVITSSTNSALHVRRCKVMIGQHYKYVGYITYLWQYVNTLGMPVCRSVTSMSAPIYNRMLCSLPVTGP